MASRRVSLPGADEIFRPTLPSRPTREPAAETAGEPAPAEPAARRRPTGRQRHDSKITVYLSREELLELERLRLTLRADHGLAVDRGRLVREALAAMLADYEARGGFSTLVRRLEEA